MRINLSIKSKEIISAIYFLIIAKLFFSFSFHLQKLEFTSYLIDGLLILTSIIAIFKIKFKRESFYLISLASAFLLYVALVNINYQTSLSAVVYYSRFWLPIVLYSILLSAVKDQDNGWVEKSVAGMFFITALGFIGLFFMPENFNHNEIKLPTYFSGLHKSAYIYICNIMLAMVTYKYLKPMYRPAWLISVFFMLFMVFKGWEIRTPMLMLVIFVFYVVERSSDTSGKAVIWCAVALFITVIMFFGGDIDWNRVSSGRLAMWDLKVNMIKARDYYELLFGTGYGSDYVEVEGWFGEKDSHNNYIQTIIELGFLGLTLLLFNIAFLFKVQTSNLAKAAVLSYTISGLVSNGLIYRLVPSYVFIILLITLESISQNKINTEKNHIVTKDI